LLCIKADTLGAGKAKAVHAELVEILMAWHRGKLCPRSKTPLIAQLLGTAQWGTPPANAEFVTLTDEGEDTDDGLKAAVKAAGGIEALALALHINPSAVEQWKRVPAERVMQIERLTNIPRDVLRPDLCSRPKDD
jgi:hypothetical protein